MPIEFKITRTTNYICDICGKFEVINEEERKGKPVEPDKFLAFAFDGDNQFVGCCLDHVLLSIARKCFSYSLKDPMSEKSMLEVLKRFTGN